MIYIFITIFLSMMGVLGDTLLKLAGSNPDHYVDWKWFIVGLVIYSSTGVGWFFVLKHLKLSGVGVIYGTSTVLALTLVGWLFFKESITVPEGLAILFGLTSIVLLARFA